MITLVLGGTRSGKSAVAERLVAGAPAVTYVATAALDPDDEDHAARIELHRRRRPDTWTTEECDGPGLAPLLGRTHGTVLVDSLGTWITRFAAMAPGPGTVDALVAALQARRGDTVVVSEEVGLSPHAPTELGRAFADSLGMVNQAVSAVADRALLVVAGRALELPAPEDPPC